jgi:hypothetical protein
VIQQQREAFARLMLVFDNANLHFFHVGADQSNLIQEPGQRNLRE